MNKSLVVSIKTNGTLENLTEILCLSAFDLILGTRFSFKPWQLDDAISLINSYDEIISHDAIAFVVPALKKLFSEFEPRKVTDTMVLSRMCFNEVITDITNNHCDSWDFDTQVDCDNICSKTVTLYKNIINCKKIKLTSKSDAIELEHQAANILDIHQRKIGMRLDVSLAKDVEKYCNNEINRLLVKLGNILKPHYIPSTLKGNPIVVTPSFNGILKGNAKINFETAQCAQYSEVRLWVFSGSDADIIKLLKEHYGWIPKDFTENGNPRVGNEYLEELGFDCIDDILDLKVLKKIQGYVSTGESAWLKMIDSKGVIRHKCNHIGASTHRASHSNPNLGQIPAPRGSKLKQKLSAICRAMFKPVAGYTQVGVDLSGIELRVLAHYLHSYDNGRYANIVVNGDVHWETVLSLGLFESGTIRDKNNLEHENARNDIAKVFIYAYIYGCGIEKARCILKKQTCEEAKNTMDLFSAKLGLDKLKSDIAKRIKEVGMLKLIDGRCIKCDSDHKGLNYLLQGTSAVIAKRWMVICHEELAKQGYKEFTDYHQLVFCHDELQFALRDGLDVNKFKQIILDCIDKTGKYYNLKVSLSGEAKSGANWSCCH